VAISSWIDESMRYRPDGTAIYVLATAVVDNANVDDVRDAVRVLAGPRRPRVHWRDADESERRKLVQSVGSLDAVHVVVVGTRLEAVRQERGRRHCLRRLLWKTNRVGVAQSVLESRGQTQDRADLAAVAAWRATRQVPPSHRVEFARPYGPTGEPMLWLPDIVAGAVTAARGDGDLQYLLPLQTVLSEHVIAMV
jgi:hypothetical protein